MFSASVVQSDFCGFGFDCIALICTRCGVPFIESDTACLNESSVRGSSFGATAIARCVSMCITFDGIGTIIFSPCAPAATL